MLGIDHLETRTMLSAIPIPTPTRTLMPASIPGPPPSTMTQETLNLQLQPGPAGSLAAVAPLIAADGGTVQSTTIPGLYTVQVPAASAGPLAAALAASPAVSSAAPVRMVQVQTLPNDPNFTDGQQWQLNGTWGINAPGAWSVTTGSNGVIVADVDSGVNYNLNDLSTNIWLNQAEIPASVFPNLTDVDHDGVISFGDLNAVVSGVKVNQGPGKIEDSDGDGIITPADVMASTSVGGWGSSSTQDGFTATPGDYIGWNFVSGTNTPTDTSGHGTFTATEIAEVGNNGLLGTGVAWTSQLMPVAFIDSQDQGTDTNAAAAIEYAVDHGAKVINASWGGPGTDQVIADAMNYADQHGVIVVAAAGNTGSNDDTTSFMPASYSVDYPNLISVAATDINGALPSWSNYGVKTVQLAAPGNNVSSMGSGGNFTTMSGTSMAAPLVTGTIALVEAAHPGWSMTQVIDAVLDHTTPDPNLAGKVTTGGIVNAAAAVANTDGPYVTAASPSGSINGSAGLSSVQLTFNEEINPATFTAAQVTLTGPTGTISGVSVTPVAGSNDHQFTIAFPTQTAAGAYRLTVGPNIQDWYGNAMNQNRDGVNGQAADAFVETIQRTAPGAGDILGVTGIPSIVTAGATYSVTVTALAPAGGTDTSYVGTVDFTSTDAQAGLPAQYTFQASDAGVHTFSVILKTAGFQAVTATDTSDSTITGSDQNILVDPTTAASLALTGFPTTDSAGAAETFTVTAHDEFGNVASGYVGTLHFTSSDAQAILPANSTITPEDQGTATFTATLATLGSQSITATDTSNSSLTASETGITVEPGAAVSFQVAGFPTTDTAGAAEAFTVTAYDAYGNIATGYTGTVNLSSTDPRATFQPATYTFVTSDDGKHTFTATLKTAGAQSITVTDSTNASVTGSETGITVQPGALAGLAVTGFPTTTTAGTPADFVVSAVDAYGNTVTGYTGTVDLSTSDALAVIQPSSYTFLASDNGKHTFTATFKTAGSQSITATDPASNDSASETGIAVQAAAARTLQVAGLPSTEVAGTAFSLTVTAYDAYGNVATGFADPLNLSSTDPRAVFQPSSHTFTTNDAGTFSFTTTLETAGSQTITFTDPTNAGLSLTTAPVVISPAAISALAVSGFPATVTAGAAHGVTVTAYDAYGNVATGYTGTVTLGSSDGQAVLPASYTFSAADAGIHQFAITLKTAGNQSITASDSAAGLSGTETGIAVNAAAATGFRVSGFPTLDTAGAPHEVIVTAVDPFGNTVSDYTGTVALTSSDGQAVLPASHTFTAGDAGTFPFSVTLDTAGNQSITATDQASNLSGIQAGIVVGAAAASRLVFSQGPTDATAGTAIGPAVTVRVEDAYHNLVTSDGSTVTLTLVGGTFEGGSNTAGAAASGGIATFPGLKINAAGRYTLTASDGSLTTAGPSDPFTISPAAPDRLVVATEPSATATAGQAFAVQPVIRELDAFGNLETADSTTIVTASPAGGTGTLGGSVTATLSNGVATFQGLAADSAGTLAITFTAGTLTPATSSAITVSSAPAAKLVVTGPPPGSIIAGQSFTMTVAAQDAFGNPVPSFTGEVTISILGDPGFTTAVAAHGGVATFTGLTLNANASGQAIQVSAPGLTATATPPMTVTPAPTPTPTGTGSGSGSGGGTNASSPPPTIVSERIVTMQKTNRKGKHVGKPVFAGFALQFSAAMDATTAGLNANYQLEQTFRKRLRHKLVFVHRAVALAASYDAATHTVTLTVRGKPKFAAGGQLTILASAPGGVSDASGTLLAAADTQFLIGPKGRDITLG